MPISDSDRIKKRFQALARTANAKARKLGQREAITAVDLFHMFTGACAYCGDGITPMGCTLDHVIAFDRGGLNVIGNIEFCCRRCQRTKFTKTPEEFAEWRNLTRTCPVDGTVFRPRWADYIRGLGFYCSRRCSGAKGGEA